jgi:hypothetical protein
MIALYRAFPFVQPPPTSSRPGSAMKNGLLGDAEVIGGGRYKSGFRISPAPIATRAARATSDGRFGSANLPNPLDVIVVDVDDANDKELDVAFDSAAKMATIDVGALTSLDRPWVCDCCCEAMMLDDPPDDDDRLVIDFAFSDEGCIDPAGGQGSGTVASESASPPEKDTLDL